MIAEILNPLLLPLLAEFGRGNFVLFMSGALTLVSALIYKQLTPLKKLKKINKLQAKLQADLKNHVGNTEIFTKINQQLMNLKMQSMSHTVLPTIASIIPMFMVFRWMGPVVPGDIITIFGIGFGWIMSYILISLIIGVPVRKSLGI